MKRILLMAFPVTVLVFVLTLLIGCAGVGMVAGGKMQTFNGNYSIMIETPREDILDVIAEVGKEMKLSVSGLDRERGGISLSSSTSMLTTGVTGKTNYSTINVVVAEAGKKLEVIISLVGNFGAGTQKASDRLFEDFKSKLLEKINSQ